MEPPTKSDHYGLVTAYGNWDDHAANNTAPFISDLAGGYLQTAVKGTSQVSMTRGIASYLAAKGVAGDFYSRTQTAPTFQWLADEVETCEDVIVLLGLYEKVGSTWQRKGGHWVNAAGVSRDNNLIGLSDPSIDYAITPSYSGTLYPGRVFPPEHQGSAFSAGEKKSPQSISHDIYRVGASGGYAVLTDYPVKWVLTTTGLIGLNGGGSAISDVDNPFQARVEWALGLSPYADLVITKTAMVTQVVPGVRVTYTLRYANLGLAAVDNVVIADPLPLDRLTGLAWSAWPPITATPGVTFAWNIPRLSYGQGGVVTITARARVTATLTNTAYVSGLNRLGKPAVDRNPANNSSHSGPITARLHLPIIMKR
jgi:uncharacterized repeat protein (TIGR01451 family)